MKVKLVAITKPVVENLSTAEDLIVYTARVSNPENQKNIGTGSKLLNYCIKKNHVSIFEHASMTVEIETTIPISMQILRHRSFCFQQFSARYSKVQEFEVARARRQDVKNKQNSIDDMSIEDQAWFMRSQQILNSMAKDMYEEALKKGIAKESARFLLPQNAKTTIYMTGNVRSFMHYIQIRTGVETQLEHREIALEIKKIFCEQFPVIANSLGWL